MKTYPSPFLLEVARNVYQQHKNELTKIIVVLPSRRACMYFKQYFGSVIDQLTIAPQIISMEGFAELFSQLLKADDVTLLFELFKVYREKDKDLKIEEFVHLGKSLLSEFKMIDNNLNEKEVDEMFEHLNEIKLLEDWAQGLGDEEKEDLKNNWREGKTSMTEFLIFWQRLADSYATFKKSLLSKGLAYGGMLFREALTNLEARMEELEIEKVIFAGFSQMSGVEQEIVQKLNDLGKGQTYFDADKRYLDKSINHEAGYYLRKYVNGFGAQHPHFAIDQFNTHDKVVGFKSVSSTVGEVKLAGEWLTSLLSTEKDKLEFSQTLNHTAILLPDESLLPALLKSLPDITFEDGKTLAEYTNITMGVSFDTTPLFDLIKVIFKMKERVEEKDKKAYFYFKDVQNILRHPFFNSNYREIDQIASSILDDIVNKNFINIPLDYLVDASGDMEIFKVVFRPWKNNYKDIIKNFIDLINALLRMMKSSINSVGEEEVKISDSIYSYEQELLSILFEHLKHLNKVIEDSKIELSTSPFKTLLLELLRGTKVPFTGVPIAPLQIMGMLESRALDFKNVLILTCNEGMLPTKKSVEAIIPFDIRSNYGLPTYKDKNAAFAYTFYRLFHRSEHLMFSYLDANSGSDVGEQSRYLLQVKEEMMEDSGFRVKQIDDHQEAWLLAKADKTMSEPIKVSKSEELKESIITRLKKGVSPSSISSYIRNPLTFIDQKVIGLDESDDIEEDLDSRSFGNVVHTAMEWGFRRMAGLKDEYDPKKKEIQPSFVLRIDDFKKAIDDRPFIIQLIEDAAKKEKVELVKGQNLLLKSVAENIIVRFFKKQIVELEASESKAFGIVRLEEFINHNVTLDINGEKVELRLAGMADRIDVLDGKLRIVDYKSGSYVEAKMKPKDWEVFIDDVDYAKALQISLYSYLTKSAMGDPSNAHFHQMIRACNEVLAKEKVPTIDFSKDIDAGFYFFRKINDGLISCKLDGTFYGEEMDFLPKTEKWLELWGKHLLDTETLLEDVI
ncbi:PD-(D/E)XK nuclease family protein [Flammeovirga yaeyamensis]|uniref:PD-(D/E)XK nuclease family protein n=1 Tax=Flammeovirga yaeyamensis TaxID=367791 RepID=A0AAX1N5U2_9BACT|nr:PD-(D/E)XK nuclease family protein [Flammeovirga yaeyamensis]MBB3697439.1 RecB family exonuclease [Flammeovirga yaeyamensis]NMF36133.1 hypothetical protein [Flammeovirga yaeyamensis]QWG02866.1 PD-(D/E)XK nuclease family protein [Flammeovirga yaeyamensis]